MSCFKQVSGYTQMKLTCKRFICFAIVALLAVVLKKIAVEVYGFSRVTVLVMLVVL